MERNFIEWTKELGREDLFYASTGFPIDQLGGKLILDVGCGYGRFTHTVSEAGATVIGVDLSTESINLAHRYLGEKQNVHFVQADINRLPFREKLFENIFSIGVLHHTPSPETSFRSLIQYLESGGEIAVWVYPPEMKKRVDRIRPITTRLPHQVVFGFSVFIHMLTSLSTLNRNQRRNMTFNQFWPSVMGHFDSFAPRYAFSFSPEELKEWFFRCGLTNIEALSRRSSMRGTKGE